jgi:hypothetical protein
MLRRLLTLLVAVFAVVGIYSLSLNVGHAGATTGINQELSFQGKIVTAAGLNITDNTYNMEFKIYTAAGSCDPTTGVGCTLGWTEDWLVSAGKGVTTSSGTYQVNLDSIVANNFSGMDFNSYPLYLSLQIGSTSSCTPAGNFTTNCTGDGEMKPYILLTSTPYALNAGLLGGLASSAFGQLSANETFTGTQTLQPTTNITSAIVKQTSFGSATADIFNIQTANATSILQVTGPAVNEAAVTLNSVGATRDLTLDSASGILKLGANTTTLRKTGTAFSFDLNNASASTLTITNGGGGVASLTVQGNITSSGGTINGGTPSVPGSLVLSDGSANTVTLTASGVGTNYSLTLPAAAGSTSQCLQTDSVTATLLTFGPCGAGAGANTALSNLASVSITTALLPVSTAGAIDIGSSAKLFQSAYLATSLITPAITTLSAGNLGINPNSIGILSLGSTNTGNVALGNTTGTLTINGGGTSAITNTSGNLTISTATTGTLAITSVGVLNLTGNASSTFQTSGTGSNLIVRSGATTAGSALLIDTNAVSGGSGGFTETTGNASAGVSGIHNIGTGTGTTATGAVAITTGNASAGTAGNITLDVGTSSSTPGSILIGGAARAQTVSIGANATVGTIITLGSSTNTDLALNDAQWSITGAGAATFASLALGSGNITTSGTLGTASSTIFTGGNATFSGTVNLGTVGSVTAASSVHIADTSDGTNSQLVTIGSIANSADVITLQGGGAASTIVLQTGASGGIDIGVNNVASKTVNIGSVGSTAQATIVHIADSNGAAIQTVTIGSTSSSSATNIQAGSGNINLATTAGGGVHVTATAVPTVDQVAITNAGQAVTTAGVNGLSINYSGGAAAVESAGARIDLTPGGTSGGTWSGLRIVANGTGAVSGVTEYGIKLEGPTSPGVGTETGLYIGTGWDTGLNVQSGGLNLAGYTSGGNPSDPPVPATDNLAVYAKRVSGRMLLKIKGPSGLDSPLQPALFGNNTIMYNPTTNTTVTGGFGTLWAKGSGLGTVSTPTPSLAAPAITNQMHRTRHQNVVTTTNQAMGIRANSTDAFQFWMGNAAGLGGFFYSTRFDVDSYPASTIRIFAGLGTTGTEVVASDTVANDVVGLWHDTTDPASGANSFSLVTRNNATTTKTSIALTNAIAAGSSYDWYMFVKPNDTTVYYRLDDIVNGVSYEGNTSTTVPRSTIFMAPQVEVSNGTANITVGTTAIGIARIYIESDH